MTYFLCKCLVVLAAVCYVLAVSFVVVPVGAQSTDPCTQFPCGYDPAVIDPTFSTSIDETVCADPSKPCTACIANDPDFVDKLGQIKFGAAPRTIRPRIIMDNWLTQLITTSVAGILLREAMNISWIPAPYPAVIRYDVYCCPQTLLHFESWWEPAATDPPNLTYGVSRFPNGYAGVGGIYVQKFVTDQYPLLATFHSLKIPEYLSLFPPAFSTPCTDMRANASLPCGGTNWICDELANAWPEGTCDRGRYVPPQCKGENGKYCREILHADPSWDTGILESWVKNTGLNFTIAYVGVSTLTSYVINATTHGIPLLFYGFEPDPLTSKVDAQPVAFARRTKSCVDGQALDPANSTANCSSKPISLTKVIRRTDLGLDADFSHFFENFKLSQEEIADMLKAHKSVAGTASVHNISCDWVRKSFGVWSHWTRNTPPPVPLRIYVVEPGSIRIPAWGIALVVVGGVAVVVVLAVLWRVLRPEQRDNAAAPKDETKPFAVAFTDIQSSTTLWAREPEAMSAAVDTHHRLIRHQIKRFHGYEVKTIGDSFMVAFSEARSALDFAVALQEALQTHDWGTQAISKVYNELTADTASGDLPNASAEVEGDPISLQPNASAGFMGSLSSQEDASFGLPRAMPKPINVDNVVPPLSSRVIAKPVSDAALWNGLRVRVGVHYGHGNIKFDPVSLGYDYYGTVVNTASRVEGVGHGGQVLITEAVLQALQEDQPGSAGTLTKALGPQPLRGLDKPVLLHQVLPASVAGRKFGPLRLDVERGADVEAAAESMPHVMSLSHSGSFASTTQSGQARSIEGMAERAARSLGKRGAALDSQVHAYMSSFTLLKTLFSTTTVRFRADTINTLCLRWRVSTDDRGRRPDDLERSLMSVALRVTPAAEVVRALLSRELESDDGGGGGRRGLLWTENPLRPSDRRNSPIRSGPPGPSEATHQRNRTGSVS